MNLTTFILGIRDVKREGGQLPQTKGRVIAITGKGGTGKTALAAMMLTILIRRGNSEILAIDADSAISLAQALGIRASRTVGDIREDIINIPGTRSKLQDTHIRTTIADILEPGAGFYLLVMGRPEGPGCFCAINDLLRYGIESLSRDFALTIVDCEAGPEQINRRVLQNIDTLIIVTDTSARGMRTAELISNIARVDQAVRASQVGLVVNRVKGESKSITQAAQQTGIDILGYIPEDENIASYDYAGKPILELPGDSPGVVAVEKILEKIGLGIS